ncbi:hypothetical protein N825_25400 [Skermanella stibiiresistens SB22]|uniref:Uncharacterized protein n=1 Tax=Skermanella stibiiresistens SB22 TaxID=1385369 RepID=W9GZ67_9PROT|nr:DUF6441 family protein [Skermanella stibiiresistens]EWY36773.1 hypothetical protein N825_25400 [Skermanella stibiiresistens SB22]
MKIHAAFSGNLSKMLEADLAAGRKAVTAGVRAAGDGLRADLQAQVRAAGLGERLARTWRRGVFPKNGQESLGAATLVWSRAPTIVTSFAEGSTIKGKLGLWLAIPTSAAPRQRGGRGSSRRPTPASVEEHFARPLRFIYRSGRSALLVMDMLVASVRKADGKVRGYRNIGVKRAKTGLGQTSVVMFNLVKQTRMPKRLDIDAAARKWQGELITLIVDAWNREAAK